VAHAASVRTKKESRVPTRASEARSSEARSRAEASFKKEERAREGAKAMEEYVASGKVVRERMAQLKALRLAQEANKEVNKDANKEVKKVAKAPAKPAAKVATARKPKG
jgi:NADH:ubiquinone oxidoreductase subunit E